MTEQRSGLGKHGGVVTVNCAICAKPVTRDRNYIAKIKQAATCSFTCCYEARRIGLIRSMKPSPRGPDNPLWEGVKHRWYGINWREQRDAARLRDGYSCQHCGILESSNKRKLEVHHITRLLDFETPEEANVLTNLVTLCTSCHRKADAVLYYARRAAAGLQPVVQERVVKYSNFDEVVCLLARSWLVASTSTDVEGAHGRTIASAISRPGLHRNMNDRYQANTLHRANTEIEEDCWRFTIADQAKPDTRSFEALVQTGDNKRISSAQRVAYLDWQDVEGKIANRKWHARVALDGAGS